MDDNFENVPERTERWVNLYRSDTLCATKADATAIAAYGRVGIVKVTYEGDTPVAVELVKD